MAKLFPGNVVCLEGLGGGQWCPPLFLQSFCFSGFPSKPPCHDHGQVHTTTYRLTVLGFGRGPCFAAQSEGAICDRVGRWYSYQGMNPVGKQRLQTGQECRWRSFLQKQALGIRRCLGDQAKPRCKESRVRLIVTEGMTGLH